MSARVAMMALLAGAGCNAIASIEPAVFDPCLEDPKAPECEPAQTGGGGGGRGGAGGGQAPAPCGNGAIDPGEECDDENAIAGDGCTGCLVDCAPHGAKDPVTHHCYEREDHPESEWSKANEHCAENGRYLATVTSASELAFVITYTGDRELWIGGYRNEAGAYAWTNGDCVKMREDGFEVESCEKKLPFLCERSPAVAIP
jgi:cysteine-rich repeat protein